MFDLKAADYIIAVSTMLGPVLAVQAQRVVDRLRQKNDRRLAVFRTLMSTRASLVSPTHVEALNSVPIEFYGNRKIQESWDQYYAHLNTDAKINLPLWRQRSNDLLIALLSNIATKMKYRFSEVALSNVYLPTSHVLAEEEQSAIRRGLASVLSGKQTIKMDVISFPVDQDSISRNSQLHKALLECIAGVVPVKVELLQKDKN